MQGQTSQIWHFWTPASCIYSNGTSRFIQGHFYELGPLSKSLHGQPPVLGNTSYSKLTTALHGFPAIARLSCSTCFVLSHSNEISCRRVVRLVSPSWFVAEMTGGQKINYDNEVLLSTTSVSLIICLNLVTAEYEPIGYLSSVCTSR